MTAAPFAQGLDCSFFLERAASACMHATAPASFTHTCFTVLDGWEGGVGALQARVSAMLADPSVFIGLGQCCKGLMRRQFHDGAHKNTGIVCARPRPCSPRALVHNICSIKAKKNSNSDRRCLLVRSQCWSWWVLI